jgi:hypothetical protein
VAVAEGSNMLGPRGGVAGAGASSDLAAAIAAPPTIQELKQWYTSPESTPRVESSGKVKHGKEDEKNEPHVGGGTWAGGTGGTDTAGLGGVVGPYRLDKGHTVHQVPPELKKKVPPHLVEQARQMGREELARRLKEIGMSEEEHARYTSAYNTVHPSIQKVQNLLERLKIREGERVWQRHQTTGVFDDAKLIEGIAGEAAVFKRRVDPNENANPWNNQAPKKKKRLLFVLDVSASMYRFNGADGRLNRLLESAVLIMEAFNDAGAASGAAGGIAAKVEYSIVGHNGDSDNIELVPFGEPPKTKKERLDVCMKMVAHSQFCWTGDNTVEAMKRSIKTVTKEEAEDYFVFVVSDANLAQYGITPNELARIMRMDERVKMYCIFIASIGSQASHLQKRLPAGHGFECTNTSELPLILQSIFTATDLLQ